jgi:hypothetical protein
MNIVARSTLKSHWVNPLFRCDGSVDLCLWCQDRVVKTLKDLEDIWRA